MNKLFLTIGLIMLASFSHAETSEGFSAFFRYEQGVRVDYSKDNSAGKIQNDTISPSAVLHILIPSGEKVAKISLSYGSQSNGRKDNTWDGYVIQRSPDMICITCTFGVTTDKVENYIIYPKQGVGFVLTASAYLGTDFMQRDLNQNLPFGSASVLRLKKFEK